MTVFAPEPILIVGAGSIGRRRGLLSMRSATLP